MSQEEKKQQQKCKTRKELLSIDLKDLRIMVKSWEDPTEGTWLSTRRILEMVSDQLFSVC